MEYRHIFLDQTSNQRLSSQVIQSGAAGGVGMSGAEIVTGADVAVGVQNQLKDELSKSFINQPLNQATGGLWNPIRQSVKMLKNGAGVAMLAAGGTAIAYKALEIGVQALIQKHEERIEKLENEAQEANNNDNMLIKAGKMNIRVSGVTYNKYGKAVYKTDRS